jgi:hypothetical protein
LVLIQFQKYGSYENGTSGSQNIIISQGSGANITIPAGDTKVVYSDGAGAGAAFFDAFTDLNVGAINGIASKTFGTDSIMIGDTTTGTIDAANYNVGLGVDVFAALTSGDTQVLVMRQLVPTRLALIILHLVQVL